MIHLPGVVPKRERNSGSSSRFSTRIMIKSRQSPSSPRSRKFTFITSPKKAIQRRV